MSSMSDTADNHTDASRIIHSRLSKQQKTMLERLMDNHPFPRNLTQKHWSKIAYQLNQIPGARKNWMQWRQTWKDIKKNARKSHSQSFFDCDKFTEQELTNSEERLADKVGISGAAKDGDDGYDAGDNEEFFVKRRQARKMSRTQKKLLYKLVNTNARLQKDKCGDPNSSCIKEQKEWERIALKLNFVTGPQKTWIQWKKCWSDIHRYYVRRDAIDQIINSESDDFDISLHTDTDDGIPTINCMNSNTPSATQLICLVTKITERRDEADPNIWMSLSNTLNAEGPCVKNGHGWKNVWNAHKSKVQKLVVENGTRTLDNLQRLTYEYIKWQRSKNVCSDSVSPILKEPQLQLLQRTADQECNIVGNLVAVKLRSMQKEQKLIAEKLISEVLFQGQMEMFQYSDRAVNIPGYFSLN